VESGIARCPRCVSVADYVFIESRSGREYGRLRYEVRCRKCGEHYGEDSRPFSGELSGELSGGRVAVAESPIVWPPDREPVEVRDWRSELRGRLTMAAQRGKNEVEVVVRRTRSLVADRRSGLRGGQIGG
ncbi:MAG: hypothetical protein K0U84_19645, partial [Actinomycetia bacterium]|nr:hypothetical protein [Actinomycetes bacterium]